MTPFTLEDLSEAIDQYRRICKSVRGRSVLPDASFAREMSR
jgi:hypothetical protein